MRPVPARTAPEGLAWLLDPVPRTHHSMPVATPAQRRLVTHLPGQRRAAAQPRRRRLTWSIACSRRVAEGPQPPDQGRLRSRLPLPAFNGKACCAIGTVDGPSTGRHEEMCQCAAAAVDFAAASGGGGMHPFWCGTSGWAAPGVRAIRGSAEALWLGVEVRSSLRSFAGSR